MFPTNAAHIDQSGAWQHVFLGSLIASADVLPIPTSIVDRDGQRIDTSGNRWVFPLGANTDAAIWNVDSPILRHSLMSFSVNRVTRVSSSAGWHVVRNMPTMLQYASSYPRLATSPDLDSYRSTLILVMQELANSLRQNQTYWRYWLPVAWYKWGASRSADFGFDQRFAQRLESLRIPGGPKGESVRSNDPLRGPLDHELERPLLQLALLADTSTEPVHLQQRLAIALTLSFGRNPLSFRTMFEEDFRPVAGLPKNEDHSLSIPCIKKREAPRTSFQTFLITPALANLISQVISANESICPGEITTQVASSADSQTAIGRPIFIRANARPSVLETSDHRFAFCMRNFDFNKLLSDFVERHQITSPITSDLLHITSRRMRYTFATDMVDMGLSKAELAVALGHTDTQNVRVYYDIGTRIVPHLEKAARGRIEPVLELFLPNNNPACATDSREVITKHPPVPLSCYSCPAFKAYAELNHVRILKVLEAGFLSRLDTASDATRLSFERTRKAINGVIDTANGRRGQA